MTIRRSLLSFALLALSAGALATAAPVPDVTGKWTTTVDTPNGSISLAYDFKQDGAKLTGTVQGPQGDPLTIQDGKIDGDKISFTVTFSGPQGEFKITNEGTIKDEEITLQSKIPNGPEGGIPPMTLKRAK